MCRRNQLFAWAAIAFGLGLWLGARLGTGLFTGFLGFGVIVFGFTMFGKKQA